MVDVTGATSAASTQNKVASSASRLADTEETFLKLLTTQMKNQDPLSPVDSTQFTQQIVQMTGVEQSLYTNQLLQQMIAANADNSMTAAVSMIGKQVTASGATSSDPNITGVVSGVAKVDGALMLKIGDQTVPVASVLSVAQPAEAA